MKKLLVILSLAFVSCSGAASCSSVVGADACAADAAPAECPELHPPALALADRCEALWSGSSPCVSLVGCGAPVAAALFVISTTCDGVPVDAWCCKDLQ